jgi:hypothetical protein
MFLRAVHSNHFLCLHFDLQIYQYSNLANIHKQQLLFIALFIPIFKAFGLASFEIFFYRSHHLFSYAQNLYNF